MNFKTAVFGLFLLFNLGFAQKLSANPYPPLEDGIVKLTGSGFPANALVSLVFNAPKPTKPDGLSLPASVKTDANGGFLVALKVAGRLSLAARAGTKTAELKLNPSVLSPMPDLVVRGDSLEASLNGVMAWSVRLHPKANVKLDPVKLGRDIFVPDGASVLQLEPSGNVVKRFAVSGLVVGLEARGAGLRVNVDLPVGLGKLSESFNIAKLSGQNQFALLERPVFFPSPVLLETFEGFAKSASQGDQLNPSFADVSQRTNAGFAFSDPTNPFFKIYEGAAWQVLKKPEEATLAFTQALNVVVPFYIYIREAALFERLKLPDIANELLKKARKAYGQAGYDPAIAVSSKALEAYGNPLGVARQLFKDSNVERATVWLSFLRDTMPRFENSETVFLEFAKFLETKSRPDPESWRSIKHEIAQGVPYSFGVSRIYIFSLGVLLALIAAFVSLWLVLSAKYSWQQAKDLKHVGGAMGAWGKAPLLRLRHSVSAYLTLTEKIVLLTLLALMVGALGTWTWSSKALDTLRNPALNLGTLGGVTFWNSFATKPASSDFDAIRGLASLLDGDLERAATTLEKAPENPMALNNLGVLALGRGDRARATQNFQAALQKAPAMLEASINNGANPTSSYRYNFHRDVNPSTPMLAFAEPKDIVNASQGKLEMEFAGMVSDPWSYLTSLPLGLPMLAMNAVAVLILAILALNILSLLIPRVRSAKTAPRNVVYHFLALLVPGSGLADEVWGIILLVPWAFAGGLLLIYFNRPELVPSVLQNQSVLGIEQVPALLDLRNYSVWVIGGLGVLYLINFIGWLLETLAWNKKLKTLAQAALTQTQSGTVQTSS